MMLEAVLIKRVIESCWIKLPVFIFLLETTFQSQLGLYACNSSQPTEDVVLVRRAGSDQIIKRKGTVIQWKGDSLSMQVSEQVREIPNEEIVELQTYWPEEYQTGLAAIQSRDFQTAIPLLTSALDAEKRSWAKRMIRADLIQAFTAIDRWENAVMQFLAIYSEDPQTRFFSLCPLKWVATANISPQLRTRLMNSNDPIEQLLGSSWGLVGGEQQQATKVMEQLTRDLDPRIQKLAAIQLWRLRALNINSINERQLQVWETRIQELELNLQAGPYYLLAEIQMKKGQTDPAVVNWLRIPILYPEHPGLAAAALYQTSLLLQNSGKTEEAQSIRTELQQTHSQSVWMQLLQ